MSLERKLLRQDFKVGDLQKAAAPIEIPEDTLNAYRKLSSLEVYQKFVQAVDLGVYREFGPDDTPSPATLNVTTMALTATQPGKSGRSIWVNGPEHQITLDQHIPIDAQRFSRSLIELKARRVGRQNEEAYLASCRVRQGGASGSSIEGIDTGWMWLGGQTFPDQLPGVDAKMGMGERHKLILGLGIEVVQSAASELPIHQAA